MVGVGNTKKRAKISLIGCGGDVTVRIFVSAALSRGLSVTHPFLALSPPNIIHFSYGKHRRAR